MRGEVVVVVSNEDNLVHTIPNGRILQPKENGSNQVEKELAIVRLHLVGHCWRNGWTFLFGSCELQRPTCLIIWLLNAICSHCPIPFLTSFLFKRLGLLLWYRSTATSRLIRHSLFHRKKESLPKVGLTNFPIGKDIEGEEVLVSYFIVRRGRPASVNSRRQFKFLVDWVENK